MSTVNTFFSGSIPENYDRYLGPLLFEPYAIDLAARIPALAEGSVLELACGTGRVTNHLRRKLPRQVRLVATDLNPEMIAVARAHVKDPLIEWMPADMQALPFSDNSFDCVVCQYGIMFVPDKLKAFNEVFRILREGGTFHFNTWDKIENNGVPSIANRVVAKFFNDSPPAFYGVPFSMFEPERIKELALQAGFSKISVELVRKEGRSDTAADAAKGMIEGNPILKEISDKAPNAVGPVRELVRKEISSFYGDGPIVSPLQAWVIEASK